MRAPLNSIVRLAPPFDEFWSSAYRVVEVMYIDAAGASCAQPEAELEQYRLEGVEGFFAESYIAEVST
jgi:hypothetical protein